MQALEVDCTKFTVQVLAAASIARIVTELPNTLETALPVIQVFRIGGPSDGYVLDIPTMTLHAYAGTQEAANRLLHTAWTVLHTAVGQVVALDGGRAVMTRLRNLGGPTWAAYDNTNVRHAVLTVQPRIKFTP